MNSCLAEMSNVSKMAGRMTFSGKVLALASAFVLLSRSAGAESTNVSAAVSSERTNPKQTSFAETNGITTSVRTNTVDKDYEALLALDNDAQGEVDQWIQENNEAKAKGKPSPDDELNRKIMQRFEPVKKGYETFIQKYPDHARARLAYGGFLNDIKEEEGAQAQWEKALQLDPTNPAAYNNLAGRYAESGHEEKGFEYFAKAIELKPDEPLYYQNFGDALYVFRKKGAEYYKLDEQQVFAKVIGLYSNALRLDPTKFVFASTYADAYYAVKPFPAEAALKAWANAMRLAKTDLEQEGVMVHMARVKMVAGRYDEARKQLTSVTNAAFGTLKASLLKNIAEREKDASDSKTSNSKLQTPEKLEAPNINK
jgi:tetratricopeptide (TPR) repeat protein